ncbi:glycosyltransferase [Salimicrobium salexigens]|uniref:Glycosyltransferase involved in cell wall bisynthesis n=1 Tax=Salimicrobium salexigens TaxID=908941 RepID=A0ABY1KXI3_9BACI|nr:glycosyltransferase [Salimicrobium salexigens]SIS82813.1 Glycosyltransferase involved in cell wall bisynthesis [Salimicrobium salexigens]
MRVLFCHDGPLKKDENNSYYGTAHNDETFKRYYNIANELTIAIRVNEISEDAANNKLSKITVSPLEVIRISDLSSLKGALFRKSEVKRKIKKAVKNSDYIVVRLPSLIGYLSFDEAKKQNKPCLVELVACPWDAFWNHSLIGKGVAPFMYYSTKKRVKKASHVIYVTNEFLQRRYPTKGINVNCSNVSLKRIDDSILEKRLDKITEMQNEQKIIIGTTAAVNVKYKGQQDIIQALGKLKSQGITNFEYQLIGGGDQSYLKAIAKRFDVEEQVIFLGPLSHSEVFDWLDRIDIYAQPSKQEGLPRALIEAMSRGLPAIGAKTAGIPELIDSKHIFSNTKNNIDEIISMLLSFEKKTLIEEAIKNFNEAKNYQKEIIETRRKEFFSKFRDSDY